MMIPSKSKERKKGEKEFYHILSLLSSLHVHSQTIGIG